MLSFIALLLSGAAVAGCAETESGRPAVLPSPVAAAAEAPLVKVAEYRMREKRFAAAAVVQGSFIYIMGGSNEDNTVLDSIERFDCRTGVAENFGRLRRGRLWHEAVLVGDAIYVLGGEAVLPNAQGEPRLTQDDSVEIIDLATGKISPGPALPQPRRSFAAVWWDGKIHLIGGCLRAGAKVVRTNTSVVFDLKTQRWSPGAPVPTAREAEAALVDGSSVVVAGGYNGVDAMADVELLNLRDGTWQRLPPLARPASAHSVAALGGQLFVFGHYDVPEQCLAYDLRTRRSEAIAVQYQGARHTAAVVHQDKIYVIGGRSSESPEAFALIQVFALQTNHREQTAPLKK